MKNLPKRFENAVMKLYNAFHENRLDLWDCQACAVGNMCDNDDRWMEVISGYRIAVNKRLKKEKFNSLRHNETTKKTGYSIYDLSKIEALFIGASTDSGKSAYHKDSQFKGLCAVIEYLCELDNIPNIMDYTKAFETENDAPKFQLEEILN